MEGYRSLQAKVGTEIDVQIEALYREPGRGGKGSSGESQPRLKGSFAV
jgi:hypothetical protein